MSKDAEKQSGQQQPEQPYDVSNSDANPEVLSPEAALEPVSGEEHQAVVTQLAETKDKFLRAQAEWDNSRKRILREKEDAVRYAGESFLEKLLPVLDNFEMGMQAAKTATDAKAIAQGLEMVLAQFQQVLRDSGVETIDAVGQQFDPHRHEALGHTESDDVPEGQIITQLRKGYKLKDRLLRAASVFVAKPSEGKKH